MSTQQIEQHIQDPITERIEASHKQPFDLDADRAFWFVEEPSVYRLASLDATMGATSEATLAASQPLERYWAPNHQAALAHAQAPAPIFCLATKRRVDEVHEEIAAQFRELAEKNRQLQEMNRGCSVFLADVAHELRNSLHTLELYLELLASGADDKQAHYRRMARQSVKRMQDFVEDTLSLSRLDGARVLRREMQPVDLNALLDEIVLLHQVQAEMAGLSLSFQPAAGMPLVRGDSGLLAQLFINLVTNAIKYTKQGGIQVNVSLSPEDQSAKDASAEDSNRGQELIVEVIDSGLGIAPNDLPLIFERFYRVRGVKNSDIPGTGLGLAIVQEIVELHQGQISVNSVVGVGSRFCVRLPLCG